MMLTSSDMQLITHSGHVTGFIYTGAELGGDSQWAQRVQLLLNLLVLSSSLVFNDFLCNAVRY